MSPEREIDDEIIMETSGDQLAKINIMMVEEVLTHALKQKYFIGDQLSLSEINRAKIISHLEQSMNEETKNFMLRELLGDLIDTVFQGLNNDITKIWDLIKSNDRITPYEIALSLIRSEFNEDTESLLPIDDERIDTIHEVNTIIEKHKSQLSSRYDPDFV